MIIYKYLYIIKIAKPFKLAWMEPIFKYFDYETELRSLSKELVKFTQINSKYLDKKALENDIYKKLEFHFIRTDYFDWDVLATNPRAVKEISDQEDSAWDFCESLYKNIISGIKKHERGSNKPITFQYNGVSAEIKNIKELVIETFLILVEVYKELFEDREKRRI
jgi:hypothetical protein